MPLELITAIVELVSKAFGFAIDPTGFENMKLEHQIKVIHAAIEIARANGDTDTVDALFDKYRELSKSAGS